MPFETAPDDLVALRLPMGEAEQPITRIGDAPRPGLAGPAFREGNWLVSMLAQDSKMYEPEPKYTPLKDIADSRYLTDYGDEFVGARSSAEVASIKAGIDRRERDQEIIQSGGWLGTVAGFGAGLIDPLNLISLGTIYRGARVGYTALRSSASVAGAAAITAGASEGLLNLSHPERSLEQTIFTMGTATIIGGILGAGGSRFVNAFERKAAMDAFDTLVKKPVKGVPTAGDTSLSAAAADTRELQPRDLGVAGKAYQATLEQVRRVPIVGKPIAAVIDAPAALVRNIGPTNRVAYGEFAEAKRAMFDLAESPGIVFQENLAGAPTVRGGGPAVETHARLAILGGRYRLQQEIDGHWKDYYWGNENERFGQIKAKVAQLTGKQEQTQLSIEQFREEVSRAMRRNDEHVIPQVAAVAKLIRNEIFDPWKKLAIDLKLLPEDVETETALSYLMRVYDREKIIAQRPQFEGKVTEYLSTTQAHNAKLKNSLSENVAVRKKKTEQLAKLDARIASAERRFERVEARLSERGMEATAAELRADTVMARQEEARQAVEELKQFRADLAEASNTPEIRKQIAELDREVRELESGITGITEKDLEAIDLAERKGVLTGPMRKVARIMTGKGAMPKGVEPFWKFIARLGGVKDSGGDLKSLLGEKAMAKGGKGGSKPLVNPKGFQWDDLQVKLAEQFQELKARGYGPTDELAEDFSDEIRDAIAKSFNGEEPAWYLAEKGGGPDDELIASMVGQLDELQAEGVIPKFESMDDFGKFFSGRDTGMTEADYDKIITGLDEGSANMDTRVSAIDVANVSELRRVTIDILKDSMTTARSNLARARVGKGKAGARVGEASIAATRNMRRADILDKRSEVAMTQRELLAAARHNLEQEITALRTQAEMDLAAWKGKSSAEGLMAIEQRTEAERVRSLKQEAGISTGQGRLAGADAAVDRSIRRALASDKDLSPDELKALSSEIVQRILSTPDGRLSYDAPTGGPMLGAPKEGPPPRGPLAHRSFMIPDEMIEDWLVNDVEQVANMYLNTMVPDTLITQRFGNVDMEEAFKKLRDEFTSKREGVTDPAKLKALNADYEQAVTDLAAVRDRVRNVYGADASNTMRNAGRVAQSLSNINVLADMGGSAISQLNDLIGPIARYGFQQVFADGYRPFLKGMMAKDGAFAEAAEQYRAMGIGLEMQLDTKPMAEVGEEFHPRTKAERTLKAATGYYMVANFSAPVTAKAKNIAAVVAGNEIIRASKAIMEGKATAAQIRNMGESSITPELAERIAQQFDVGGVVKDGVYLPNTADWTDDAARLAFEGAVSREANIAVVTPGQEKPLWLSHPVARLLGQFKSFTASATTRILLANLQRRDAAVLQGVFAQIAMGMLGYKIYSTVTGRETSDRPQDWVKEGISRSGIVGWLDEGNALLSKATGGTADMYKMIGADKPLSRYASRSTGSQLLGPSWGKLENAIQIVYAASKGEVTQSDIHAGRRLMPMQNLFYIRLLLDEVEQKSGEMLGVPKRAMN